MISTSDDYWDYCNISPVASIRHDRPIVWSLQYENAKLNECHMRHNWNSAQSCKPNSIVVAVVAVCLWVVLCCLFVVAVVLFVVWLACVHACFICVYLLCLFVVFGLLAKLLLKNVRKKSNQKKKIQIQKKSFQLIQNNISQVVSSGPHQYSTLSNMKYVKYNFAVWSSIIKYGCPFSCCLVTQPHFTSSCFPYTQATSVQTHPHNRFMSFKKKKTNLLCFVG